MSWRWQVVWTNHTVAGETERVYSLCEVYLDKHERLTMWSEPGVAPLGTDIADLRATLTYMLTEAYRYTPVRVDELKVGMTFQRACDDSQARELAKQLFTGGQIQ